jgi:hypothetical protein
MNAFAEGAAIGFIALGIVGPGSGLLVNPWVRYVLLVSGLVFLWRMR